MSRRGSPAVQILVVVVVVLFFLYGFYSYHEQHTRLKHSEELSEKYKQKSESLSAQLQVLYEHKNRLENAVQEEKKLHKDTKESLELTIKELQNEQNRQTKAKEAAEAELESVKKDVDEKVKELEKVQLEKTEMHQQCENEKTQLRDAVADNRRRYEACESKRPSLSDGQQQNQAAEDAKANQNAPNSDEAFQIKQPGDGRLPPQALPGNNVLQPLGEAKGSHVDNNKNIPAPNRGVPLDSAPAQAPADSLGGESSKDEQPAVRVKNVEPVQDQHQQNQNQVVVRQPAKVAEENSNVGVQDDRPVNQQNVNKVADKEEDYAGDVEKPQQQQQQQQQQNDAVVGQVAKPAVNADAEREENVAEEDENEVAKDKEGAGL